MIPPITFNVYPHGGVNNGFFLTQAQSDKRALFTLGKTRLLVFPRVNKDPNRHAPWGIEPNRHTPWGYYYNKKIIF